MSCRVGRRSAVACRRWFSAAAGGPARTATGSEHRACIQCDPRDQAITVVSDVVCLHRAHESLLHMAFEMDEWLEKWVRNHEAAAPADAAASTASEAMSAAKL